MTNYFDLEQQILGCWNIVNDLESVLEFTDDMPHSKELDTLQNMLIGLKELYQVKFNKCFETFEDSIRV